MAFSGQVFREVCIENKLERYNKCLPPDARHSYFLTVIMISPSREKCAQVCQRLPS
jgi:hypothetical protein